MRRRPWDPYSPASPNLTCPTAAAGPTPLPSPPQLLQFRPRIVQQVAVQQEGGVPDPRPGAGRRCRRGDPDPPAERRRRRRQKVVPPFDRSSSLRYPTGYGGKKQGLARSSSSRVRSLTDPVVDPQQLLNQEEKVDHLETNHFVLVHGGGFGAWCWYKTIALLEDNGFKVNAIDLTGSRVHSFDMNNITGLVEYVKPLTSFLGRLGMGRRLCWWDMILVVPAYVTLWRLSHLR